MSGPSVIHLAPMKKQWLPDIISLVPDQASRDKCVASIQLKRGSALLSDSAYVTALLNNEKGRRCDFCLSLPRISASLKRCTGCGSYWYCNEICDRSSSYMQVCSY